VKAPEALLFDFGGTLDSDGVAWKDRFFALLSEEGARFPASEFERAFYSADDALVGALPRDLALSETVGRLAEGVARALGLESRVGDRVAARFLEESRAKLTANAPLLERLSSRFRLGVVSNFYGNLESVCAETGIGQYLAAAVDSAAVGFQKPDRRIFEAALAALGSPAENALFIGDSLPRDMGGARQIGMPHVWLAPGAREACCPGDAVIGRLEQLAEVLA
jgi:putative hydrolase of the HAD superfamily